MESVDVGNVGQSVEGAAVGNGDEYVVVAGVGQARSESAERRFGNAGAGRHARADVAAEPGFIGTRPWNVASGDEFDPRRRSGRKRQGKSEEKKTRACGQSHAGWTPECEVSGFRANSQPSRRRLTKDEIRATFGLIGRAFQTRLLSLHGQSNRSAG